MTEQQAIQLDNINPTLCPPCGQLRGGGSPFPTKDIFRRLFRNKLAIAGMVILGIVLFVAVFAPLLAIQDPNENGVYKAYPRENKQAPTWEHPMGTDDLGRDISSLIFYGARISVRVGIFAVGLAILVGAHWERLRVTRVVLWIISSCASWISCFPFQAFCWPW